MTSRLRRTAILLAVVASVATSQDVKALVQDLRYPGSLEAQKASRLLRDMPVEAVIGEIGRALKEDQNFQQLSVRSTVYQVLSEMVMDRRKKNQPIDRVLLEQLRVGVSESAGGIRLVAVNALDFAQKDVQEEVAVWITPALEDSWLDVAEAAARALKRFEGRAASSAPALLKLLQDPDEATRKRWAIPANGPHEFFGTKYPTEDSELRARMAAARARVAVLGSLVDFDLYPKLDEKGRVAGAMGMVSEQGLALIQKDAVRARQAVVLVAPLIDSPMATKAGNELCLAAVMVWAKVALLDGKEMAEARADATARIEEATKHANERVSKAAAQALEMLKKRK